MTLDDLMLDRDEGVILPIVDFREPHFIDGWVQLTGTFTKSSLMVFTRIDEDEDFIVLPWKDE